MDTSGRLALLFDKYLQKSCSPQELKELLQLLEQAGEQEHPNSRMLEVWKEVSQTNLQAPLDWDHMYQTITGTQQTYIKPFRGNGFRWYYAAAAVLLLLIVSAVLLLPTRSGTQMQPVAMMKTDSLQHANTSRTIRLPDGSKVVLNSNSKLDYPSSFKGPYREVYVTGEAFFDIVHNPKQPFIVHAGSISTKVLGTSFNIRAYPADEKIEVTVVTGKVQVSDRKGTLGTLSAAQQITFNKSTQQAEELQRVNTAVITAWKPAEIRYDNRTMEEVVMEMQERFNIHIVFASDALKNCRVTATFSEDDLPEEMLAVICVVANATYTNKNNIITIEGNGCP